MSYTIKLNTANEEMLPMSGEQETVTEKCLERFGPLI